MKRWLVTAFAPFGGASTNSSRIVLDKLRDLNFDQRIEFLAPVPVEFANAWKYVRQVAESKDFAGVLALGQAETRARIGLERVALNWIDARLADNAAFVPPQGPIGTGPELHWSHIPWEKFALSGYCERSYSAGTYVCNTLMFQLLEWSRPLEKMGGFVHIPALMSQKEPVFANSPKMPDEIAVNEVERILRFVLEL